MEILTEVTSRLCCLKAPDDFVPDFEELIYVPSLDERFGTESSCSFSELYAAYYDSATNTWKDGDTNAVSADIKADVANALVDVLVYQEAKLAWDQEYAIQKEVQYKVLFAEAIIAITEP